ncbi:hypothetical protein BBAD15_g4531 [Beauveria bassiana D1-5]|uniref:Ubiquitin-like domain-containing protein n=1 Tax=Beauveria bassiana D1-5 TaxID=1245745 RepID=A0A0A2VVE1_BEABA|nr:hypothetical protein BBAD15_g4531 [Beauveria bassiana D1-5]
MASTTAPAPTPPPPLLITVRFSSGLADLAIDVPTPDTTTVLAFKHNLRQRIASRSRLRLIYQGRILLDGASLAAVLKPLPAAPPAAAAAAPSDSKGKAVDKPRPIRVYLNCSIGDELSTAELDAEEAEAAKPPQGGGGDQTAAAAAGSAAIRTERFASDAMPSPDTMRGMEDAWIDGNAGELPSSTVAGGALDDDMANMSTVLDVLIRAMMIGFFFPLGSMTWLLRQDVWGEKWRIFVGSGVVLSLTVGVFMTMGSEH